jgi:hypothetical protein
MSLAASARMATAASAASGAKAKPFKRRNTIIAANAARLLPSTNGWLMATPKA